MNTKDPQQAKKFFSTTVRQLAQKHYGDMLAHRDHIADYDLSDVESDSPKDIHITFYQPRSEAIFTRVLPLAMAMSSLVPQEELKALAASTLQHFREENNLTESHSTTRKIGNTTVHFSESTEESTVNFSINNTPVRLFEPRELSITDYLPQLLVCHQALEQTMQDKLEKPCNFPSSIDIHDHGSISVDYNNALNIAPNMLLEINPESWPDILRHERGHVLNGDTDAERMDDVGFNQLLDANDLLAELDDILKHEKEPSEYFFQPDFAENFAEDRALLAETLAECKELAAHIQTFPEYDTLDTLGFAADLNEKTGLFNHLGAAPPIATLPDALDICSQFSAEHNPPAIKNSDGKGEVSLQQADENFVQFKAALSRLIKPFKETQKDLCTAAENIMQAREHLADVESVKHAEDPHRVRKTFEFIKATSPDIPEDMVKTHPTHDTRIETATRFADRVKHMRENESKQQRSR